MRLQTAGEEGSDARLSPVGLVNIGDASSLAHLAYEALSDYLLNSDVKAGDRLAETQLANALGVSRGPIRQALQQLASEGWVEIRPRVGAFVARRDRKAATDFFQVRHNLEVLAAGIAAESHTESDLAEMRNCVELMKARAGAHDNLTRSEERAREYHRGGSVRFHEALAHATHNETLIDFLHLLAKKNMWYFTPEVLVHSERAWTEHDRLCDLIEAGDAAGARELMDRHMDNTLTTYLERMQ